MLILFVYNRHHFKNAVELVQLIQEVGRKLELTGFKDDKINTNLSSVDFKTNLTEKNGNDQGMFFQICLSYFVYIIFHLAYYIHNI